MARASALLLPLLFFQELVDETLLVDVNTGVDGVDDSLMKQLQVGLLGPGIFNGLESLPFFPACSAANISSLSG